MGNVDPVFDYPHDGQPNPPATVNGYSVAGNSITGGVAYRGRIKWLQGSYVFADFANNSLYSIAYDPGTQTVSETTLHTDQDGGLVVDVGVEAFVGLSSLDEGEDGEIYVCSFPQDGEEDGRLFVLTQAPFYLYRSTYFTASELADPAISGALMDPDEDEMSNVEEFAMGSDPTVAQGNSLFEATVETAGGSLSYLTVTFPRNPESFGYVDLIPRSGNLVTMDPGTAVVISNTSTEFKARDTTPVNAPSSPDSRFMDICFDLLPEATELP